MAAPDASRGTALLSREDERSVLEQRLREDDDDPGAAIPWESAQVYLHRE